MLLNEVYDEKFDEEKSRIESYWKLHMKTWYARFKVFFFVLFWLWLPSMDFLHIANNCSNGHGHISVWREKLVYKTNINEFEVHPLLCYNTMGAYLSIDFQWMRLKRGHKASAWAQSYGAFNTLLFLNESPLSKKVLWICLYAKA